MEEEIEICWFAYQGNCTKGKYCKWKHVSKAEIDLSATYVFCSGVDHRRTPKQTRDILERDLGFADIKPFVPSKPLNPFTLSASELLAKPPIRAIRFKLVTYGDGWMNISEYESQQPWDEVQRRYKPMGEIYDPTFVYVDTEKIDFQISLTTLAQTKEPKLDWADD